MSSSVRIKPLYEVSIYTHFSYSYSHLFVDKASANDEWQTNFITIKLFVSFKHKKDAKRNERQDTVIFLP